MRITIEVSKKEFQEMKKAEFLTVPLRSVSIRCGGDKSVSFQIVAVSVSKKNQSMLIQVEGKK